jgi:HEAT repeat protein
LFFVTTDGQSRRVSQTAWPDGLRAGARASRWEERWPGDAVWAVLFDDTRQQEWLGVGAGLAILRRDATTLQHFGSSEGVCCGPVSDGISLDGKLYFASGWDDARGGLTVFDPQTRVFTPFLRAAGMDTDMVVGLEAKDGQLELRYGVEYLRDHTNNNPIWRQCRPGRFDPASGQFTSGGEPEFPPREVAEKRGVPATVGTLPFLGGPASRRYEHDGKTWLCGSRGLVVFPGNDAPAPTIAALNAQRAPDLTQVQREESKRTEIPKKIPLDLLRKLVAGPNKYVRANALAAAYGPVMMGQDDGYVTVIAACMKDPYSRVRTTAVFLLANSKSDAALPPLRLALDDNDPAIRAVAAVTLAKRGELPALSFFEDILRRRDGFSSIPFGEISNIGVDADNKGTRAALAPYADRKVFELLVSYPPDSLYYNKNHYAPLGAALRKHPDAAAVLLAVQDAERHGLLRDYVQRIFQQAGKELLPLLYDALAGNDRVVRSNAARACGAIGDPSSIPPLIQALDMESGLARASIVWALGELKANEAVPILIELHQDARNAEHNRQTGAGYMEQQASSANREAYTALRNLDAIASDWEELKVTALRRPRDPRRDEELLTPETVLEALRKIGSAAAPQFYRTLAAATASNDRAAAAVGLAEVTDTSREMNLTILRNLLGDPDPGVRLRARVSLMLHGESAMDGPLRDRLRAGDHSERWEILGQLERLPGPLLELFRKDIEAIASNTSATESLRRRAAALLGK